MVGTFGRQNMKCFPMNTIPIHSCHTLNECSQTQECYSKFTTSFW